MSKAIRFHQTGDQHYALAATAQACPDLEARNTYGASVLIP